MRQDAAGANLRSMAVRVRLTRVGGKKNAIWRVVVADRRAPRDGRFIEMIGHYNPQTQPSQIVIDRDRLQHWLDRGAEPTNTVKKLMRAEPSAAGAAVADAPAEAEADESADAAVGDGPEAEAPAADSEACEAGEPTDAPEAADAAEPAAEGDTESG